MEKKSIHEATSTTLTSGPYSGPVELGLKKWLITVSTDVSRLMVYVHSI